MSPAARAWTERLLPALRRTMVRISWVAVLAGFVALSGTLVALPTGWEFELAPVIAVAYGIAGAAFAILAVTCLVSGGIVLMHDWPHFMTVLMGVVASGATLHALSGVALPLWADWSARMSVRIFVDPTDPSILRIDGAFPSDLPARLENYLGGLPADQLATLVWVSPTSEGGQLRGMVRGMGVLRSKGLTAVRVDGACLSACALMWMMADRRVVAKGGVLGFHSPTGLGGVNTDVLADSVESFLDCETGDPVFARAAARWPSSSLFHPETFWLAERGLIGTTQAQCELRLPSEFAR